MTTHPGHIVFSHANGFPAGTYRLLFERWRARGWHVHAIDKLGHASAYPVTSNWPHLCDELLHFTLREAAGARVWLVGHSLGGYLSVLAAARRPELARGIVLLDSPIVAGWRARVLHFGKASGLNRRYAPGAVARRRRQDWPSAEAAYTYFAGKPAFARFDPAVLRDYIDSGTERAPQEEAPHAAAQQRLTFNRDIETAIYDTLPHHIAALLRRRPLACPVAFIGGTESAEVRMAGMRATERLTQGRVRWLQGSHLFPMEQPAQTAQAVLDAIEAAGT